MHELRPGLWHWRAPHLEWSPKSEWPEDGSPDLNWLPDVASRLRPLLDRPIELVLPAHGEPTDRAALERALLP